MTRARRGALLLVLLLAGCGAAVSASRGTTRGATCVISGRAFLQSPVTQWGTSATPHGFHYPYPQLVGWDWCEVSDGEPVRILGTGQISGYSAEVIALKKGCVGSVSIDALTQCSGGDSFLELVFPVLRPQPVRRIQ